MAEIYKVSKQLADSGIVPVVKLSDTKQALPLAATLLQQGLPVAEITLRTPCALNCIEMIHGKYPGILLGAGTVLTIEQAKSSIQAGASFIVCPGLVPEVVEWCLSENIPVYPGVCTPTEICQALALGLNEFKFFPASNFGGLKTLKSFLSVFDNISFMPTGGISLENCREYLETPGILCCGGSFIAPVSLVENGDFDKIAEIVKQTVAIVKTIHKNENT